jgi:hypothetical protein
MDTGGQRAGDAYGILGAPAEGYRLSTDGEPLSGPSAAKADNCGFHRNPPASGPALSATP